MCFFVEICACFKQKLGKITSHWTHGLNLNLQHEETIWIQVAMLLTKSCTSSDVRNLANTGIIWASPTGEKTHRKVQTRLPWKFTNPWKRRNTSTLEVQGTTIKKNSELHQVDYFFLGSGIWIIPNWGLVAIILIALAGLPGASTNHQNFFGFFLVVYSLGFLGNQQCH